MNRLFKHILLLAMVPMVACSNDEPSNGGNSGIKLCDPDYGRGVVDAGLLDKLSGGEATVTFNRTDVSLYQQDALTGEGWEQVDLSDYMGWYPSATSQIVIYKGKTWTPYELFTPTGPEPLMLPWQAYQKKTGSHRNLYISTPFAYDSETMTVAIGVEAFKLERADESSFNISRVSRFEGGRTGKGGNQLEVAKYTVGTTIVPDMDKILAFGSEAELIREVMSRLRATFGSEINLDEVYDGTAIFDDPVINLDELENQLAHNMAN